MSIKMVVAVTDSDWFDQLRQMPDLCEVNFWAPSAANFRALSPSELFLFKLHAPRKVIVGGGIFAYANKLPGPWPGGLRPGERGQIGAADAARIARYRRADPQDRADFEIGCRILTQPFFFEERDWISVPKSWAPIRYWLRRRSDPSAVVGRGTPLPRLPRPSAFRCDRSPDRWSRRQSAPPTWPRNALPALRPRSVAVPGLVLDHR